MSGGDGVFFNQQIVGIETDGRSEFHFFFRRQLFSSFAKTYICKLGKKSTPAKTLLAS